MFKGKAWVALLACVSSLCAQQNNVTSVVPLQKSGAAETVLASDAYYLDDVNITNDNGNYLFTRGGQQLSCFFSLNYSSGILAKLMCTLRTISTGAISEIYSGLSANVTDDHDAVSFGIDKGGYIWLSFGMHDSAFVLYKSNSPMDPSAFTAATMAPITATGCTSWTYPMYPMDPHVADASRELYFAIRCGVSGNGDWYFLHYNYGSTTWEAAAGTSTNGLLINGKANSPKTSAYPNGTMQFGVNGHLYWNWEDRPNGGSDDQNQYVMEWNGTSFLKLGGAAQTVPVTNSNLSPCVSIAAGNLLLNTHRFSVDDALVLHIPWQQSDGTNLQWYQAETGTIAGACTAHQLTHFTDTPAASAYQFIQLAAFSIGQQTYIVVPDIFSNSRGTTVFQSANNFVTAVKYTISHRVNPNWVAYADPVRLLSHVISLVYQDANATGSGGGGVSSTAQYLNPYVSNPNLGKWIAIDWAPNADVGYPNGPVPDEYFRNTWAGNVILLGNCQAGGPGGITNVIFGFGNPSTAAANCTGYMTDTGTIVMSAGLDFTDSADPTVSTGNSTFYFGWTGRRVLDTASNVVIAGHNNVNAKVGSPDRGISWLGPAAGAMGNGTQGSMSGTWQAGVTATDPGCTTASHIGKQWFNITTTTTVFSVCLNVAGTVGWVQVKP